MRPRAAWIDATIAKTDEALRTLPNHGTFLWLAVVTAVVALGGTWLLARDHGPRAKQRAPT